MQRRDVVRLRIIRQSWPRPTGCGCSGMSIGARCKAARRGCRRCAAARHDAALRRQGAARGPDWRSRRFPLVDVGHCNAYDHPAQGRDAPRPPTGAQPHQAGGEQQLCRRRDDVAGAPPAAGDDVLGSTRRRRNSAPAVTSSALALVLWSVRRRLDMSEAAPDCSPTAMADGRVAPMRHAGCRWAPRRRLISSRRYPAPHEQQRRPRQRRRRPPRTRRRQAALRELAIGERRVVADEPAAAAASRRMMAAAAAAAAARACVVRLINHYKFFGRMLKPVTGPWGAGPS